ncbi:hypothetical protein O6H91_Y090900 [Diphasiastrum complanatum]|nr:hypothetical protein O6H91_Y090900 [Diphasiastrum complanatum]
MKPRKSVTIRLSVVVISVLIACYCSHAQGTGPSADAQALLDFQRAADLDHKLNGSWTAGSDPCTAGWTGIRCDGLNQVIKIELPNVGLRGNLGANTVSRLSNLHVINLMQNSLSGSIPPDLGLCTSLWQIFLNSNGFNGSIPDVWLGMHRLHRLYLSNNSLQGQIPVSLATLRMLYSLRLEGNHLSGSIPDLGNSNLTDLSFADNNLLGQIPFSFRLYEKASFLGNPLLCGDPLTTQCEEVEAPAISTSVQPGSTLGSRSKRGLKALWLVFIALADVVVVVALTLSFLAYYKHKYSSNGSERGKLQSMKVAPHGPESTEMMSQFSLGGQGVVPPWADGSSRHMGRLYFCRGSGGRRFGIEELLCASAETLGKGSVATTYKVALPGIATVVVKRLLGKNEMPTAKFEEHMGALGKLTHPNVVPLFAYYHYGERERLLIYEYMPNGSLHDRLHGKNSGWSPGRGTLPWTTRRGIAHAVSKGLTFLHEARQMHKLPHGNINSSNILLDANWVARISGFSPFWNAEMVVKWGSGYRAPECNKAKHVSQKADVYSYGVLLLEILSRKQPSLHVSNPSNGIDLPLWINSLPKQEWRSALDSEIAKNCSNEDENEMLDFLQIALKCCSLVPAERPKMTVVHTMIEQILAPLPKPNQQY